MLFKIANPAFACLLQAGRMKQSPYNLLELLRNKKF